MSNLTINQLPSAASIDPVNDLLPIFQNSSTSTLSINRNTYLGLGSAPVGLTDTQTLTNKTLTSPTISSPTFSGTTAGTFTIGGTVTFPSTVVSTTGTQTLTNKTLTSPTINSPTITNATISADTITGYTTSNSGTIYGGISVTTGNVSLSGTLGVTGATTLSSTLSVGGFLKNTVTPVWQYLGYTQVTTNVTTPNTSVTDVTGLSATVTVPTGVTAVRITSFCGSFLKSGSAGDNVYWYIRESSTTLNTIDLNIIGSNYSEPVNCSVILTGSNLPSSGTHTYKISTSQATSGTIQVVGSSTAPVYILVECC